MGRASTGRWLTSLFVLASSLSLTQDGRAQDEFAVSTNLPSDFVPREFALELTFNRPLESNERVAVLVGDIDLSDLFVATSDGTTYTPGLVPLPSGQNDLTVYLVSGDVWREVAREPLRVLTPLGFEQADWDPRLDVGLDARVDEGHDPDAAAPRRETYEDVEGRFDLTSTHVRGDLQITSRATVVGVNKREQALRFGTEQRDAPKIDLSSYTIDVRGAGLGLALGHVAFGSHRHLVNGMSSRGTTISFAPSSRVDLSFAAMNGNPIVGWDNFAGIDNGDNLMLGGSIGVEALERPGGLRFEVTLLDASKLPRAGFNQGVVNDAEESRGAGFHLAATTADRSFRFEGGFSRSRYDNPDDPLLSQGADLVPVEEETKNARYLDVNYALIQNAQVGTTKTATVSVGFRHHRVDPLYNTIGTYVRSDDLENRFEVRGAIADIGFGVDHTRSEDNLDEIPSILTSKTRRTSAEASLPLARIFDAPIERATWIPDVRYRYDRTKQFGDGIPEDGGFNASHIPDQISVNQTASADWRGARASFGYQLNHSSQDNRQEGRENADFNNLVNRFSVGVQPHDRVSLNGQVSFERREAEERDEVVNTDRIGMQLNWTVFRQTAVSLSWAITHTEDEDNLSERDDTTVDAQWSGMIPYLGTVGGQYFIRYGRTTADVIDRTFDLDDERENWNVDMGLNLSFFGQ